MHPKVSLSAISTLHWTLDEDLAFYEEAAIDNVGVSVAKLEQAGWEAGARRIAGAGLRVTNLIGLGPFHLAAPGMWEQQRERVARALDVGHALGAECVVFTTGPAGRLSWEEAADALAEALRPLVAHAHGLGIPLALEHTNPLRVDVGFVHSLRDVVDVAHRLATGVCMEVNACWAERGLGDTITAAVGALRLVQVSDYAIGTLSTPNRLVPGDGDIPLERILRQVLSAGYGGCFDLELVGPRIEEEGYAAATRRGIEWLTRTLESLGATISG